MRSEDFDVAVSYRMPVDHGFVQLWEAMLGDFKSIPILPIFVNAAAPPVPTYRRARQLGKSVGRFAAFRQEVLFAASAASRTIRRCRRSRTRPRRSASA